MSSLSQNLLTEGLIIAAVTFCGYTLALSYEAGYLAHFGVPVAVAELSAPSIAKGSFWVLLMLMLSALLFRTITTKWELTPPQRPAAFFIAFFFILAVLCLSAGAFALAIAILSLAATVGTLFIALPLLARRKAEDKWQRLGAATHRDGEAFHRFVVHELFGGVPEHLQYMAGVFMLALFVALTLGAAVASETTTFWVDETAPDEVIIRIYGSRFVSVKLDDGKLVRPNFSVQELPADHHFVLRKIGPLEEAEGPE